MSRSSGHSRLLVSNGSGGSQGEAGRVFRSLVGAEEVGCCVETLTL